MSEPSVRARLRAARARGSADGHAFRASPAALERSPLGDFGRGGSTEAALRRLLHSLRVPPAPLALAARALNGDRRARALAALERYAYWRGARRSLDADSWRRLTRGPAILMYHAFGSGDEPASRFVVPARRFERQLRRLRRRPVLPFDELVELRRRRELPPAGSVVITIDDGYADTLEVAAPILRRFGLPATVFAVSGRVGGAADWDGAAELGGRPLLDWDGLRALGRYRLDVGAHTRTHPRLPELDETALAAELAGSRADLEAALGQPVRSLAYPFGRTSRAVVAAAGRAGFAGACGIARGLNDPATPLLELRRSPVDGDASTLRFELAVRFGDPDFLRRLLERLRASLPRPLGRRHGRSAAREATS